MLDLHIFIDDVVDLHHQIRRINMLALFLHLPEDSADSIRLITDVLRNIITIKILNKSADLIRVCIKRFLSLRIRAHCFRSVLKQSHFLKVFRLDQRIQIKVMLCQQLLCICGSSYNLPNQFLFINGRIDCIPPVLICCIIIQRLLQGSNNTYIVYDEAVALAGSNTVCPGDCLHQRMRLQRLIQIQTRQRLNIETSQPHRANEHNTEIAIGIFKFLIQLPLLHLCPVRQNIQIPLLKGLDLILLLAYDHTHLGVFHPLQLT